MYSSRLRLAHHQLDLGGVVGEEHGRLARRVPATDDHHRVADALLGLDRRGRVVDAGVLELLQSGAPGASGPRTPVATITERVGQPRRRRRAAARSSPSRCSRPTTSAGHGPPGAELLGLQHGALGQLAPGDPGREAEVVLDPRRPGRLAAGGDGVEHRGVEALRRPVDRGREPGGSGADDHQVADLLLGVGLRAARTSRPARRWTGCAATGPGRAPPACPRGPSPSPRSSRSADGSVSRSTNRCGSRLRAANSRSVRVPAEYRDPTIRKPIPSPRARERRIR